MPETFEKQHYSYAGWSSELFSEIVTVKGPGTLLYLSGIGAEDSGETAGTVTHAADVYGQAQFAFEKASRVLAKHGATLADVVKITAYLLDTREFPNYHRARSEAFQGLSALPAHTLVAVSGLAWPNMLMEIDITAVIGQ